MENALMGAATVMVIFIVGVPFGVLVGFLSGKLESFLRQKLS